MKSKFKQIKDISDVIGKTITKVHIDCDLSCIFLDEEYFVIELEESYGDEEMVFKTTNLNLGDKKALGIISRDEFEDMRKAELKKTRILQAEVIESREREQLARLKDKYED